MFFLLSLISFTIEFCRNCNSRHPKALRQWCMMSDKGHTFMNDTQLLHLSSVVANIMGFLLPSLTNLTLLSVHLTVICIKRFILTFLVSLSSVALFLLVLLFQKIYFLKKSYFPFSNPWALLYYDPCSFFSITQLERVKLIKSISQVMLIWVIWSKGIDFLKCSNQAPNSKCCIISILK